MRTLIYIRVSTEDQIEKYGLPAQLRACREYAGEKGYVIVLEIADEGISGTVLERAGLDRVRQMVRDGLVDIVLMLDADRLSRELAHLLILKPEIERRARLEFVTAKFEDSPSGRMFFGIRGVIAQYERELTRERTMRGKKERARAGLIVGGRIAYGYRYRDGQLIVDEPRANTVRRIFADFDAGQSMRAITLGLRERGEPTYAGRRWGHSSVRRILTNETYAGVAHYGTHRREGKVLRLRASADRISLPVPAVVARELWLRVQARLSSPSANIGRPSSACLLRGLLYCHCGRRMHGDRSRGSYAYRCAGRDVMRHSGEPCKVSINARAVDSAVWSAIRQVFMDSGWLRSELAKQQAEIVKDADSGRLPALRAKVEKLRRREDAAIATMIDPDMAAGRAAIKSQYRAAVDERRRVESEIATAEQAELATVPAEEWLEETVSAVREYIADLENPAARQEFVRRLVGRAEYEGGNIRMALFIDAKMGNTSARCAQFRRLQITVNARVAA